MLNTHSAGGVVRNTKGEIAIVNHDNDFWGFPKGHVDEGEEIIDAAVREVREEVGVEDLTHVMDLGNYTRQKYGQDPTEEPEMKTIHMFLFDTKQEEFVLTDPRHQEARWVPVEDVVKLLSSPDDQAFFEGIKSSLK